MRIDSFGVTYEGLKPPTTVEALFYRTVFWSYL